MREKIISNQFVLLLGLVILTAFMIRVVNLNFNSPFLDEAIYINLGKRFWAGKWHELSQSISWVGGFPFFYPPIAAALYYLGGIMAARTLSVFLGVASVFLVYKTTRALFPFPNKKNSEVAAIEASALMATSAIPIAFSRLATYDAFCIFLFMVGVWQLVKAIFDGERNAYLISALFIFLAFLAKYIVAIYILLLLLATLYLALRTRRKEVLEGILTFFWLPLVLFSIIFVGANFSSLLHFISSKATADYDGVLKIIWSFLKYSPVVFVISIPGFYLMIKRDLSSLAGILVFGALLPLFFHLITGESASVHQHSVFSLIFLLPVIGFASVVFLNKFKITAAGVLIMIIFLNFLISVPKVRALGNFWPNTNEAAEFLKLMVLPGDKILVESEDPIILALSNKLDEKNIEGPFDFTYQGYKDREAYLLAIRDGYFNYIELDGIFFKANTIRALENDISIKYFLIYDKGSIRIWKLKK